MGKCVFGGGQKIFLGGAKIWLGGESSGGAFFRRGELLESFAGG